MKNLKITVSAMMVIMSISGMSASFRFFKKKNFLLRFLFKNL